MRQNQRIQDYPRPGRDSMFMLLRLDDLYFLLKVRIGEKAQFTAGSASAQILERRS